MRLVRLFILWFGLLAGTVAAQVPVPAAPPAPDPQNILHLALSTGGEVVILMRPDKAAAHVERVRTLTRAGFYDGVVFHRVIEGFMAQTGDPKGTGEGGSPLSDLKAEFNDLPHLRGTVSMARTEQPDSANSQFFVCFQPTVRLDGKYTVIGRVTAGMQFVDAIKRGDPLDGRVTDDPSKIVRAWIEADGPNAPRVALVVPAPAVAPPAAATPAPEPETPKVVPAAGVAPPAAPAPAPEPEAPKPNP